MNIACLLVALFALSPAHAGTAGLAAAPGGAALPAMFAPIPNMEAWEKALGPMPGFEKRDYDRAWEISARALIAAGYTSPEQVAPLGADTIAGAVREGLDKQRQALNSESNPEFLEAALFTLQPLMPFYEFISPEESQSMFRAYEQNRQRHEEMALAAQRGSVERTAVALESNGGQRRVEDAPAVDARRANRERNETRGLVSLLSRLDEEEYYMDSTLIEPIKDLALRSEDEKLQGIAVRGLGRYLLQTENYADETVEAMAAIAGAGVSPKVTQVFFRDMFAYLARGNPSRVDYSDDIKKIASVAANSDELSDKLIAAKGLLKEFNRYKGDRSTREHKQTLLDAVLAIANSSRDVWYYRQTVADVIVDEARFHSDRGSYEAALLKKLADAAAASSDEPLQNKALGDIFSLVSAKWWKEGVLGAGKAIALQSSAESTKLLFAREAAKFLAQNENEAYVAAGPVLKAVEEVVWGVQSPQTRHHIAAAVAGAGARLSNRGLSEAMKASGQRIQLREADASEPAQAAPSAPARPPFASFVLSLLAGNAILLALSNYFGLLIIGWIGGALLGLGIVKGFRAGYNWRVFGYVLIFGAFAALLVSVHAFRPEIYLWLNSFR